MIFKSRQVNLDPYPYAKAGKGGLTYRRSEPTDGYVHDPRPEFDSTRDPEPWQWSTRPEWRTSDPTRVIKTAGVWVWAPRREQFDTPVNRVLAEFRVAWDDDNREDARYELTLRWFEALGNPASWRNPCEYTTDEIDHAGRVMARLWGWGREQ